MRGGPGCRRPRTCDTVSRLSNAGRVAGHCARPHGTRYSEPIFITNLVSSEWGRVRLLPCVTTLFLVINR